MTVGRIAQCEIHIDDQAGVAASLHADRARVGAGRHRSRIGERHVPQRAAGQVGDGAAWRPDSRRLDGPRVPRSRRRAARACHGQGRGRADRDDGVGHPQADRAAEFDWLSSATSALPARARCCSARSGISRPCTACPKCWPAPAICKPWRTPRSKQSSTSPPPIARRWSCGATARRPARPTSRPSG